MSEIQKPDLLQAIKEAHENFKARQAAAAGEDAEAALHEAETVPQFIGEKALHGDDVALVLPVAITQQKRYS